MQKSTKQVLKASLNILPTKNDVKALPLNYERQKPISNAQLDKFQSSLKRQLSVELIQKGFHRAFRDLLEIFRLENQQNEFQTVLLENQPEKLRFLCLFLSKVEETERKRIFPLVLKNLLTLAEFFSRTDEFWLAERFYKQSLEVVEKNPDLDREFGAESCLKFGQALENRFEFHKALEMYENALRFGENNFSTRAEANRHLARLFLKLSKNQTESNQTFYIVQSFGAAEKCDDEKVFVESATKLAEIELKNDRVDRAIEIFHRIYDYSKRTNDFDSLGRSSVGLAISYQRKHQTEKSIEYLESFLSTIADQENHPQFSRACSTLGFIHLTMSESDVALKYLNRAYCLCLSNDQHHDLDRDRVLSGIANAFCCKDSFDGDVKHNRLERLLSWKSFRTF